MKYTSSVIEFIEDNKIDVINYFINGMYMDYNLKNELDKINCYIIDNESLKISIYYCISIELLDERLKYNYDIVLNSIKGYLSVNREGLFLTEQESDFCERNFILGKFRFEIEEHGSYFLKIYYEDKEIYFLVLGSLEEPEYGEEEFTESVKNFLRKIYIFSGKIRRNIDAGFLLENSGDFNKVLISYRNNSIKIESYCDTEITYPVISIPFLEIERDIIVKNFRRISQTTKFLLAKPMFYHEIDTLLI